MLGILAEFLPLPENRVTLADTVDENGMPVAHFNYSHCENDDAIIAYAKTDPRTRSGTAPARRRR